MRMPPRYKSLLRPTTVPKSHYINNTCFNLFTANHNLELLENSNRINGFHKFTQLFRAKNSYYDVLGVSPDADDTTIKKAYFSLAKQYHPDANKNNSNAVSKFTEVAEAYEVLGDKTKRRQYDESGFSANYQMGSSGKGYGNSSSWKYESQVNPEELFRSFFGSRGINLNDIFSSTFDNIFGGEKSGFFNQRSHVLHLTFEEAACGCQKTINVDKQEVCSKCGGRGAESGSGIRTCHQCRGSGMETSYRGSMILQSTCRVCQGSGQVIVKVCPSCQGSGSVMNNSEMTIQIPAGVDDEQCLRLSNDVMVIIRVGGSTTFRRDGSDIHSDVDISLSQACLGGSVTVKGIHGEDLLVQIPAGTQSHDTISVPGKGTRNPLRGSYGGGDHVLNIRIAIPPQVTDRQRKILLEFAANDPDINGSVAGLKKPSAGTEVAAEQSGWKYGLKKFGLDVDKFLVPLKNWWKNAKLD